MFGLLFTQCIIDREPAYTCVRSVSYGACYGTVCSGHWCNAVPFTQTYRWQLAADCSYASTPSGKKEDYSACFFKYDVDNYQQMHNSASIDCREHGRVERRGHRNMWMWGVVVASIVCCSLIGSNNKLQADKKALQKELSSARNLADMKDQVMSGLQASLSIVNHHHNSQMQALQNQLRSVPRPPQVKVWTFDGARY